jgi:hypothetical protein
MPLRTVLGFTLASFLVVFSACASDSEPPVDPTAQADAGGGKADHGDPCERDGRYGDGTCDLDCWQPDPDCERGEPRKWCDRSPNECRLLCSGSFTAEDNGNCPGPIDHPLMRWECTCLE